MYSVWFRLFTAMLHGNLLHLKPAKCLEVTEFWTHLKPAHYWQAVLQTSGTAKIRSHYVYTWAHIAHMAGGRLPIRWLCRNGENFCRNVCCYVKHVQQWHISFDSIFHFVAYVICEGGTSVQLHVYEISMYEEAFSTFLSGCLAIWM